MYLELALQGDVMTLTETGIDYMETSMPGWVSRPSNVETIMIEGIGQIAGELIDQAAIVPPEALAAIGTTIYSIPMLEGQQAVAAAVVTFADDAVQTYPVDSQVAVPNANGQYYPFKTDRDLVPPVGGGDLLLNLIAQDVGQAQNNSFGTCQLIDEVEGVLTIVATGAANGADPETADRYLDRMTTLLGTLAPRPILPEDHAAMASTVPGVGRVTVLNLYYPGTDMRDDGLAVGDFDKPLPPKVPAYNPALPAIDIPRCTTVCILGTNNGDPTDTLMQNVYEFLDANREVNFLNFVMKPVATGVDIKAVVVPYPGLTKADAVDGSTTMVQQWLSRAGWGLMPGGEQLGWATDTKLRLYEVVDYLNRGFATWYCEQVFMKLSSQDNTHWAAVDLDLPGVFPIPELVTITLT